MVSRIDIGPDGGPYVAINENSNDLELQDINGNVIAVWDETEGQWDLNNNSLTNINAIDASSANLGSATLDPTISDDTNIPLFGVSGDNGDIDDNYRKTPSVGTSATEVATLSDRFSTGLVLVFGRQDDGSDTSFSDLVFYLGNDNGVTVIAIGGSLTPDSRSYSTSGSNPALELAMGANSYDVGTRVLEVVRL